jgi:hypothetical protein
MATVIPIRPGVVMEPPPETSAPARPPIRRRWAICPVCSVRALVNEFTVECASSCTWSATGAAWSRSRSGRPTAA